MLGIISRTIEMLQDVHGKKSVLVKQKIIRSLGALIVLIGPAIHGVASQVGLSTIKFLSGPQSLTGPHRSWQPSKP
jgi:serine/threonine-protein kinase ATR